MQRILTETIIPIGAGLVLFAVLVPCGWVSMAMVFVFVNKPVTKMMDIIVLSTIYWLVVLTMVSISTRFSFPLSKRNKWQVALVTITIEVIIAGIYFVLYAPFWYGPH